MNRSVTFMLITVVVAVGYFPVLAQEDASSANATEPLQKQKQPAERGTTVLAADGAVAVGAKVFIQSGGTMTLIGSGDSLREMNKKARRMYPFPFTQTADSFDVKEVLSSTPDPRLSEFVRSIAAFYYVSHPEHGFAFVPTQLDPPSKIRLRPPATLKVHVPKQYSPDDYVVLACWMNRYADPISYRPIETSIVGTKGWIERGHESDWRLRTMVTHWVVADIEAREKDEYANTATVVLPPGEVRITLVPKAIVEKHADDPEQLQRLLLFGGPSKIVLVESDMPGVHPRVTILPSNAVRDIEFVGRPRASGIPDWAKEENVVFLTRFNDDPPQPIRIDTDRAALRIAESDRQHRSQAFLGRIAHPIGKDRYLAVGVPVARLYVWSADVKQLGFLVKCVESCDDSSQSLALQPMSVRIVSPEQAEALNHDPAKILQGKADKSWQRRLYRLGRASSSYRMLIDLTQRIVFEKVDPNIDPFTAKTLPNAKVGVIAEEELNKQVATTMDGMSMEPSKQPTATTAPVRKQPKIEDLRRRIEQLDKDLQRAKKLLHQITGES